MITALKCSGLSHAFRCVVEKNKNVIHQLGQSVLAKTVPSVLSTGLGRYPRPRVQFFPIRTSQMVNNLYRYSETSWKNYFRVSPEWCELVFWGTIKQLINEFLTKYWEKASKKFLCTAKSCFINSDTCWKNGKGCSSLPIQRTAGIRQLHERRITCYVVKRPYTWNSKLCNTNLTLITIEPVSS